MKSFYKGKKVLITGNTGFKGVWLTNVLINFQAEIFGYALRPLTNPSLYDLLSMETKVSQIFGDIRDFELLKNTFKVIQPEIVFHLAAQPLVGYSYQNPRETYDVNVMGTVNVMECIKQSQSVKSVVVITTDKVYQDNEWIYPYRETDILNGFDPYSNSKSCAELVVGSYNNSFIYRKNIPVSTVRSGNVIGGGDFSDARIVPDFLRAFINMESLLIKNPSSVRPYQHVLEPLVAYLLLAKKQYYDFSLASSYNVGPYINEHLTTLELINMLNNSISKRGLEKVDVQVENTNSYHETQALRLDISKIRNHLDWSPKMDLHTTVEFIIDFAISFKKSEDLSDIIQNQINYYNF